TSHFSDGPPRLNGNEPQRGTDPHQPEKPFFLQNSTFSPEEIKIHQADQHHQHSRPHHNLKGYMGNQHRRPFIPRNLIESRYFRVEIAVRQETEQPRNFYSVIHPLIFLVRNTPEDKRG